MRVLKAEVRKINDKLGIWRVLASVLLTCAGMTLGGGDGVDPLHIATIAPVSRHSLLPYMGFHMPQALGKNAGTPQYVRSRNRMDQWRAVACCGWATASSRWAPGSSATVFCYHLYVF